MTKSALLVLAATTVLLAACGSTPLLSSHTAPDEMAVVEGPSLALPPDFELRPPSGTSKTATPIKDEPIDARAILNKDAQGVSATVAKPDAADSWLIKAAGGDKADPDIREKLTEKPKEEEKKEKGFFSRLNPFSDDDEDTAE
ncbi:MAG: DUF3035 domain-containing protein [Proteobacteria bacterium]|nr:DUF3035 domain-containing protein [Pseudomonadota bacterium]